MSTSIYVQKPESALRRAEELESIQQPEGALALLHEVLSSRRNRTWTPIYEKIMIVYINLCLSLNKAREAKDGLHQYRNLSQSQAPGSLEIVIKYIIDEAEKKCRDAKDLVVDTHAATGAEDLGDDDDDDAGASGSPNIIASSSNILLLSTMTTDPEQNQRDSALLLPRIKFLWEAYRAVLDILKSNSKLERLYHLTAIGALQFCSMYKRRTEFKRLCELLRNHLQTLQKYGGTTGTNKADDQSKMNNKVRGWEGWTNESIELHLQTRFAQLETASTLHLYTEGFRTVEDIFSILQISNSRRKGAASGSAALPKPKLMAAYYEKLTTLFWVSENYLFHAFAWYKFYTLCREYNRGMTPEQKQYQASSVLLSALCIPPISDAGTARRPDFEGGAMAATSQGDFAKEKMTRMATLLGFHTRNPTRESLLSEIRTKNVIADVPQYLRDLYKLMEECSNPLILLDQARPLLDRLRAECADSAVTVNVETVGLGAYVEPLVSVLLVKLLHLLSMSYHTISLDHIKQLTTGLGVTFTQVEKAIVTSATCTTPGSSHGLRVRIDHRSNCLRFGAAAVGTSGGLRFESDAMRSQLTQLSKQLSFVCRIIDPPNIESQLAAQHSLYSEVRAVLDVEHKEALLRKDLIEKRKEEAERVALEKVKEEEMKRLEALANAKVEEEKRLQREQQLREREKIEKIRKEMEIMDKKRYLQAMGHNTDAMTEEELLAIDGAALAKQHADEAAKKKDNAEKKIKELQKTLDYIIRATRIEEIPLVNKRREEKLRMERERYEAEVVEKARNAKLNWEADCKEKLDLDAFSVFKFMGQFQKDVMKVRQIAHDECCKEEDKRAETEAELAKLQRARRRKQEAERRQKLEEERLKKEEEERLKREEEERKKEEERLRREEEKRQNEDEEEQLKLKEIDRMAAEREHQEREKESNGPALPPSKPLDAAPPAPSKYVPPNKRSTTDSNRPSNESSRGAIGDSRGSNYGGGRYDGKTSSFGSERSGSSAWGRNNDRR